MGTSYEPSSEPPSPARQPRPQRLREPGERGQRVGPREIGERLRVEAAGQPGGRREVARAAELGISARARLDDNDGSGFFSALDDLVVTTPTRTNVNDLRLIMVS